MGRKCKCKVCGEQLDTETAYKRIVNGKNLYYHSEQEYTDDFNKKAKAKADKDKVYRLVCDILGENEIVNTSLYKEWAVWNKVADDERIGNFLYDNKEEFTRLIARLNSELYPRIRYLSAIIKNKIDGYKPKIEEKVVEKKIDTTFYDISNVINKSKRRALDDLEDEI